MRAKATKAVAAQNMARRAERLLGRPRGRCGSRDKVAKLRFPDPAPCGKTPLTAEGLSKSYGSLEIFTDVDLAVDRGSPGRRARPQRRRQDHAAADAGRRRRSRTPARSCPGTGCGSATTPRSTRRSTSTARCWRTCAPPRRTLTDTELRRSSASFLFTGDDVDKPAGVLSGGEKTRLALATLVVSGRQRAAARRADQQPRPGQPRARCSARCAPTAGAVVLVTHDEGAVEALEPERVILLPDGVEDLWSDDLRRPGRAGLTAASFDSRTLAGVCIRPTCCIGCRLARNDPTELGQMGASARAG